MDAISAHLDRGWDLLQKNDFRGATVSAQEVLKLDEQSPEAYTLLGAIAAAQGQAEEALEHYGRAMELDPEYIDPLLYAAETYMWPLGEYEEALELCQQALDMAEEEDEYLDALLLKAEVELGLGDLKAARATLSELPPVDFPEPVYHLRAARSWLDLGEIGDAEAHFRKALAGNSELAEAVHGLGLCAEERGDRAAMVEHFLKVYEMDQQEDRAPWGVDPERFEDICNQAVRELPERIQKLLQNVPIVAADYPSREIVAEGSDPRMLGFFAGVPYPDKSNLGGPPQLDCIFLFQRNIERVVRSREQLELEVRKTILHEAGHFFGLSEEELEEMGLS
ncbi:MAG: metallopeptidase family protein [Myxococcales bacterium]|nr:metallopeptidase family protein [Myxococcota bacterium]MDW8283402.1 metallopeptidase family protein [Myxococcales bacterium]